MATTLKYSLDGGDTWLVAKQGVRLHFDTELDVDFQDQLFVNVTSEGLICDVVDMESGEVVGTRGELVEDIVGDLTP